MIICFIDFEVNKAAVAYEIKLFSIFKMTPAKPLKNRRHSVIQLCFSLLDMLKHHSP